MKLPQTTECTLHTNLFEESIKCQSSIVQNITVMMAAPETEVIKQPLNTKCKLTRHLHHSNHTTLHVS